MKQTGIFFIAFLCYSLSLVSQDYTITGTIQTRDALPIAYANIVLLRQSDSTMLKGTSTDDFGKFAIDRVPIGKYIVSVRYVGHGTLYKNLEVEGDITTGTLFIDPVAQALDEVLVTSQKPKLEKKIDRLVFNIANTALSDMDLWNVLKRTPSVLINGDEMTIKGNGAIGIMINGRKINLPQDDIVNFLSGTSAGNVSAIEVITNPPAKYSAEGGLLINIKMDKNLISGYNASFYNRYTQGALPKHTVGTDHYFKAKKTGFSVNYSYSDDRKIDRYTDITNFFENGEVASIWTAEQAAVQRQKKHTLNAFLDYDWNAKNTLSISTLNAYNPRIDRIADTETLIDDADQNFLSSFTTINTSDREQLNSSVYLDWTHQLQKKGAEFSVQTHYTYYDNDRTQDLDTDFFDGDGNGTGDNDFTIQSRQRIDLFSAQVDYISPFGNASRVEAGLRYAGITSKNVLSQQGFDPDQPGINPTEAGVFDYDESIYAAYMSYDGKWNKWKVKSGLRAEYTRTMGDLDIDPTVKENDYLELFPSFSLNYFPSKKNDLTLYYYRRITRPRYNKINPFQFFQSNNSVVEGNPDLLPSTRNYVALGYTYDRDYTVELFYRNQQNKNRLLVFQDNDANLLRFINQNVLRNISYGLDLSLHKNITSFWYSYALFSGFFERETFADLDTGTELNNSLWSCFFRTNNTLSLLADKSWTIDVDFMYSAPLIQGNARQDSFSKLGIHLSKTIWDKRGRMSMGIEDIYRGGNIFTSRDFLNQDNSSLSRRETRLFTLGFRYRLGNTGIKTNKKRKRVEERNRL